MSTTPRPREPDAAATATTATATDPDTVTAPEPAPGSGSAPGHGSSPALGSADAQAAEQARDRQVLRLAAVTTGWWAHGLVRLLLASAMVYYGVAKLVLGQFGVADMGDALITQGEMSPMGMLWRMVALSPLFQFLAGLTEFGAALALLWRRTVPLGALLAFASMVFVFVLNLGYDVPVKQISLVLALLSLIVLIPWMGRLARAVPGRGEVPRGRVPVLIPWRPLSRVTDIVGPLAALGLVAVISWSVTSMYSDTRRDESTPAGVWAIASDTAAPAEQLAEDTRWQQVAFGDVSYEGTAMMQLRLADGELLAGSYERTGEEDESIGEEAEGTGEKIVEATLRPLRKEGQSLHEHGEIQPLEMTLTIVEQADGTLHVTGDDIDLVLAEDPSGRVLYDREHGWGPRPDAPFNR